MYSVFGVVLLVSRLKSGCPVLSARFLCAGALVSELAVSSVVLDCVRMLKLTRFRRDNPISVRARPLLSYRGCIERRDGER